MLSANVKYRERMYPAEFGGLVASGVHIYEGALCAWTSAGTLVPCGAATGAAFAGMAAGERDNTLGTETRPVSLRKGVWGIAVAAATAANIGQTVYATADDTVVLAAQTVGVAAKSGNNGNGTFTTGPVVGAGAKPGAYALTFLTATTFTLTDPNGDALPNGAALAGYADAALGFSITAGTNAFQAGDGFTITVAQTGMAIGTLAGIESSQTFVKLAN